MTIADITSNVVTDSNYVVSGDGSFDDLMEAITAHIEAQFNKGRIKGTEYSNVYLGAMQAALSSAIQFAMQAPIATEQAIAEGIKNGSGDITESLYQKNIDYVAAQKLAMEEQVIDNRKIKALDSLADTYGTFGAGGITMSSEMWAAYFSIVNDLTGTTEPTSTTVTKVT